MSAQEIELYEAQATSPTLFGTNDPSDVVRRASEAAKPLASVVDKQKLFVAIQGRKHVRVEGWCLLGSMLGVFPVTVWSRKTETGWEARVEARTKHGEVIGAAEASCDRTERTWEKRDDYALRSMAQTRATSKALRQPLGFVMNLAGFDATPAEEMLRGGGSDIEDAEIADTPFSSSAFQPPPGATEAKEPTAAWTKATKAMFATIGELVDAKKATMDELKTEIYATYGVSSTKELSLDEVKGVTAALKLRLS